jgi:hypothetical protein
MESAAFNAAFRAFAAMWFRFDVDMQGFRILFMVIDKMVLVNKE